MSRPAMKKKKNNDRGRGWDIVNDPSWGDGGSFVRIFETDERGMMRYPVAEFYIQPEETVEDCVRFCVAESKDPQCKFADDYDAETVEALYWLADALDIPTK